MSERLIVVLPSDVQSRIKDALERAGTREVGGILMAEHVGPNRFVVRDITVHKRGTFASFVRRIEHALDGLGKFFKQRNYDYQRFNYLGEWHSHPCFSTEPSDTDDQSMIEIIEDDSVGANFVVLMIVKANDVTPFQASAYYYLHQRIRHAVKIEFE